MGESLKPHHGEMHNIPRAEGLRPIEVVAGISYPDMQIIQASLALHAWRRDHPDETGHVDFINPRESDRRLRDLAMQAWEGNLGEETLRGRCRAFFDSLKTTGRDYGVFDLAREEDRDRLLALIKAEKGEDSASKETIR